MKKNIKYGVYIKDISDAGEKGLKAVIPALHGAIVLGENFREIEKGILLSIEYEEKFGNKENFKIEDVDDYDYFIENLSNDPGDPAYKATIKKLNTVIFGSNYRELDQGISMALDYKHKNSLVKRKLVSA